MISTKPYSSLKSSIEFPREFELQVYYANISDLNAEEFIDKLPLEEQIKSTQFLHQADRDLYIFSRYFLRSLMGTVLAENSLDLVFEYAPNGKPYLKYDRTLYFNISHVESTIAIAIGREELGIDIESLNRAGDLTKLESFLFSPEELSLYQTLPPAEKRSCFMNCWTRKEAVLKALGGGLTLPIHELEVTFLPEEKIKVKKIPFGDENPDDWYLESFTIENHLRGAIAAKGKVEKVNYYDLVELL